MMTYRIHRQNLYSFRLALALDASKGVGVAMLLTSGADIRTVRVSTMLERKVLWII